MQTIFPQNTDQIQTDFLKISKNTDQDYFCVTILGSNLNIVQSLGKDLHRMFDLKRFFQSLESRPQNTYDNLIGQIHGKQ